MTTGSYPVKKTGSADNERLQINKALDNILDTLSRADQWDAAVSWGDHNAANYATALSELEQFADFGIPSTPLLNKTRETAPNGTEVHVITAAWSRAGDDSIVYDLEIRESDPSTVIDENDPNDIISKSDLYSVPIVSNDSQDTLITYKAFFDADTRYFFRVRIRRNTLVSNWSAFANIVTTQDTEVPPAPSALTASPIADGVRLNWNYDYDANPNVAKIEILRNGSVVDTVPRPALSYIDEPLPVQNLYNYTVRAVSFFDVQSVLSNVAGAFPNRSTVTIRQASAPTTRPDGSPLQNGDRWIDTANGERPYVRVGGSWVAEYTEIPGNNINPNSMDGNRVTARTLEADRIEVGAITSTEIQARAINADRIATGTLTANEISTRTITADKIATGTLTANEIATRTITADKIATNTLTANEINTSVINVSGFNNDAGYTDFDENDVESAISNNVTNIDGGKITTGLIQSANYVPGSTGWIAGVDNGAAEFSNIVARGNIFAGTSPNERVELTVSNPPGTDRDYRIWVGQSTKNQANGRFWVDSNGNARFGGRISAGQLEGAVFDGVPINVTASVTSNSSNVNWVTVANRFVEIPETVQRPRRPFVSLAVPVFGPTSVGAWVRCQIAIQNDNGTWGSFFTIGQEYTQDTTSVGSAAPISIGSTQTGNRGFRVRVQFRAAVSGQVAETNRWSGLFIAIPVGSGFSIKVDSTGSTVSSVPADTSVLIPPNFQDGWALL